MDAAKHHGDGSSDDAQRPSTLRASAVWRVHGVPTSFDAAKLEDFLQNHPDLQVAPAPAPAANQLQHVEGRISIEVRTLAADILRDQVATVRFSRTPTALASLKPNDQLLITPPESSGKTMRRGLARRTMTIDPHFHHITVLFAPPIHKHEVDILVVCGLGAHAFGSFVHKGNGHMWLGDSLPQDMPTARVMVYGYDSVLQRSSSFASLDDFSISVRNAMCQVLRSKGKRLILIGHSLGGLLIKEALVKLADSSADSGLLDLIVAALFFGVPNGGMNVESLFTIVKDQLNQFIMHTLNYINSQTSTHQSQTFANILQRPDFELYCFYETHQSPTAALDASGQYKMIGTPSCLVTRSSATSCLPLDVSSQYSIPIHQTHSGLVKFSPYDAGYNAVIEKLHRIHHRCQAMPQIPSADFAFNERLNYEEAEEVEQQDAAALDTQYADTLQAMSNYGNTLFDRGQYKAAQDIYQKTFMARRKLLGEEHLHTLESKHDLGNVAYKQGQFEAAEILFRETLVVRTKLLGEEHADTLKSKHNLGNALYQQGQYKAAETTFRDTHTLRTEVLGGEHIRTLQSKNNLGNALRKQGQYEAAEALFRETLTIQKRVLGDENPDTLQSISNLGNVLSDQGHYKDAEKMHQKALKRRREVLGEEHFDTLQSKKYVKKARKAQEEQKAREGS